MSEENKIRDGEQETKGGNISRRNFLKDAGLAIGAPTIGSIAGAQEVIAAQTRTEGKIPGGADSTSSKLSAEFSTIELTVNGGKYQYSVEPHWSLRQLIRDQIGFTSPKDWCGGQGACGSCTVIMNGRAVLSCMTLACECSGAIIETAEGIAKTKHPVIQAYINHNAFQCGYCTPGFVCTAKALLDKNKKPTEADVRDALGGNLCRCGTYQQHPPAVLEAAENLRR
jgi:aerobic-type carbon monoxide dehydrogenase small subunit (CoxS/CutS family)